MFLKEDEDKGNEILTGAAGGLIPVIHGCFNAALTVILFSGRSVRRQRMRCFAPSDTPTHSGPVKE